MMKKLLSVVIMFFLSSCGADRSPEAVAKLYWQAVADSNWEAVTALAADQGVVSIGERDVVIKEIVVGESFIDEFTMDEDRATVPVELILLDEEEGESKEERIVVDTHLLQVDKKWRVDLIETDKSYGHALLSLSFTKLESVLESAAQQAGDVLNEGLSDMEELLKDELREGMDGFNQLLLEGMNDIGSMLKLGVEELNKFQQQLDDARKQREKESALEEAI